MAPHDMKTTTLKTPSLATGPRPDSPLEKNEVFYHWHKDHMDVPLLPVQPFPLLIEMERQKHGVVLFFMQEMS